MGILNDKEFAKALKETDAVLPRSLWQHLYEIAEYLALIGALKEAIEVWKLAYSDTITTPETHSVWGDASVTALCDFLKHPDISNGRPESKYVHVEDDLEQRMLKFDRAARKDLTLDAWPQAAVMQQMMPNAPALEHIAPVRRGRELARPKEGEWFSPFELEALPYLDICIAHPKAQPYAVLQSHLLYADIALRHDMKEAAAQHLRTWYEKATSLNATPQTVLGLHSTAALAFAGILRAQTEMTQEKRSSLVHKWLENLRNRLKAPYIPTAAPTERYCYIFYSTLTLEPDDDSIFESEWDTNDTRGQKPIKGGASYPRHVSITVPGETESCLISIEFTVSPPAFADADYAVAVPFQVLPNHRKDDSRGRIGTVFPNTITGQKEDVGFEVPPGEYDVLARFYALVKDENDMDKWRVTLSFMPRGTQAPGILKRYVWS